MVWEDLYCDKVWQFSIFLWPPLTGNRKPVLQHALRYLLDKQENLTALKLDRQ